MIWGSEFTDLCYGYLASCAVTVSPDLALTGRGFEIETEIALNAIMGGLRIAEVPTVELFGTTGCRTSTPGATGADLGFLCAPGFRPRDPPGDRPDPRRALLAVVARVAVAGDGLSADHTRGHHAQQLVRRIRIRFRAFVEAVNTAIPTLGGDAPPSHAAGALGRPPPVVPPWRRFWWWTTARSSSRRAETSGPAFGSWRTPRSRALRGPQQRGGGGPRRRRRVPRRRRRGRDRLARRAVGAVRRSLGHGRRGTRRPRWATARPAWFPHEFGWVVGCSYTGHPRSPPMIRNPIGANMSFRRDAMLAVGGFSCRGPSRVTPGGLRGDRIVDPGRAVGAGLLDPPAAPRDGAPLRAPGAGHLALLQAAMLGRGPEQGHGQLADRPTGGADGGAFLRPDALPRGALARLRDATRAGEPGGFGRAMSIWAGLAVTATGYLVGRVSTPRPPSHHLQREDAS